MPIRENYAQEVIIVTSGEKMSLFAARNIKAAIDNFADRGYAQLLGLILNRRNIDGEESTVRKFAAEIGVAIIGDIPRDSHIPAFENQGKTVIQGNPELAVSRVIMDIARWMAGTGGGAG